MGAEEAFNQFVEEVDWAQDIFLQFIERPEGELEDVTWCPRAEREPHPPQPPRTPQHSHHAPAAALWRSRRGGRGRWASAQGVTGRLARPLRGGPPPAVAHVGH